MDWMQSVIKREENHCKLTQQNCKGEWFGKFLSRFFGDKKCKGLFLCVKEFTVNQTLKRCLLHF